MAVNEDDYGLIGGTTDTPKKTSSITKLGDLEFIFRPLPPASGRDSIQRVWMERWQGIWDTFYGGEILDYLEILKHLPYPLMTEWPKTGQSFQLVYYKKSFYELGIYPWLKSWFTLQADPTGAPVLPYRDDARRIKIRFELAEIIFNHPDPRLNLGWNSSFDGWGPVKFSSPGHLGFCSEIARCRQWLIDTNSSPFPGVSKELKRRSKKAALRQASTPQNTRQQVKDWHQLLIKLPDVVEGTATEMISNRNRFGLFEGRDRLKSLLTEIVDIRSRKIQEAARSDDHQFAWIEPDGQLFVTRKGINLPRNKEQTLKNDL